MAKSAIFHLPNPKIALPPKKTGASKAGPLKTGPPKAGPPKLCPQKLGPQKLGPPDDTFIFLYINSQHIFMLFICLFVTLLELFRNTNRKICP